MRRGAEYADVRLTETDTESFALKDGSPEMSGFAESKGIGIRVIVDGSMGFATTNYLSTKSITHLIRETIDYAKKAKAVASKIKFLPHKPIKSHIIVKPKINPLTVPPKEKIEYLKYLDKEATSVGVDVSSRIFDMTSGIHERFFYNSEGSRVYTKIPFMNLVYVINIEKDKQSSNDYFEFGSIEGWEALKSWKVKSRLIDKIKSIYHNMKYGVAPPKGVTDVVVSPEITGIIVHESAGHPLEADRIFGREGAQAGESFVTPEFVGYKIGNPVVNVVDDPTIPKSNGFYLFDDEGVRARRKFLI